MDGLVITAQLRHRPVRPIQSSFMNSVIVDLELRQAEHARGGWQRLAWAAIELTGAHSAGISFLEGGGFAWRAVAGRWSAHRGLVLPAEESPCGLAMSSGELLLLAEPARRFAALGHLDPAVTEGMYQPFAGAAGRGVMWALAQDARLEFDAQDAFMLGKLAAMAADTADA